MRKPNVVLLVADQQKATSLRLYGNPDTRTPALDMFAAANGYVAGKQASYSPEFAKRFYAAQAARNARIVTQALDRLHALEQRTTVPGARR